MMLAESLDHAFEDVSERVWIEAKLKADEMLAAIESGLTIAGEQLDAMEKETIRQCVREVQGALQGHQTPQLKKANEALDKASERLAAIIVEKAMDESMR
jgi:molecular chaperone DnaK